MLRHFFTSSSLLLGDKITIPTMLSSSMLFIIMTFPYSSPYAKQSSSKYTSKTSYLSLYTIFLILLLRIMIHHSKPVKSQRICFLFMEQSLISHLSQRPVSSLISFCVNASSHLHNSPPIGFSMFLWQSAQMKMLLPDNSFPQIAQFPLTTICAENNSSSFFNCDQPLCSLVRIYFVFCKVKGMQNRAYYTTRPFD